MSLYTNPNSTGDLWLRTLADSVDSATNLLSAVYLKYQPVNKSFYDNLITNKITRFDVIYDNIFIETLDGFIFEKIQLDINNNIVPYQNNNNFIFRGVTPIEYWFDEQNLKIYYVDIRSDIQPIDSFNFYITINEYDCNNGELSPLLRKKIKMNLNGMVSNTWGGDIANIEKPTFCYNKDTKTYNISFIFRNNLNRVALMSIFLKNTGIFVIEKINGLVPFAKTSTIDPNNILDF